ncbi:MAG: hypothetical protein D6770_10655 [Anaerolineae bacterium]|nr:MAG: hypothetical protein D6770_10655 [Anaerolineae bacterium]
MNEQMNPEITSDDKLWALLAYIFSPLVPLIIMLMEEKKARPFLKFHSMQALVLGVVDFVLYIVLSFTIIGLCIPVLLWFAMVYWGVKAYQGEYVQVPFVTDFIKNQGWV